MLNKYFSYIGIFIIFLLILATLPFQYRIENSRKDYNIIEQSLYLSSSALKRISLGYELVVADIYWIRALQYFSNTKNYYGKAEQLYKYFDIITDLDPKFINAYRYGGSFLADTAPIGLSEVELGLDLFEKGRKNNPNNFRLILDEAFIYYLYTNDYKKASELFNKAADNVTSELRKTSLKGMAALALTKSGNLELSSQIWTYIYKTSTDEARKEFALNNLKELKTIQIEKALTKALKNYYADTKMIPVNLVVLVNQGYISKIPSDPLGSHFIILDNILEVKSSKLAANKYEYAVNMLNALSNRFRRLYGRYPKDLDELKFYVSNSPLHDYPENPYGKEYHYNNINGTIR